LQTAGWLRVEKTSASHERFQMTAKRLDPGQRLVDAIVQGLPEGVELDEREEALLDLAARQARDVARCEADIETRGYLVEGSHGQEVVNPSLAEVRQSRLALGKLLGQLDLPESTRDAVRSARNAAEARWGRAS
jgi:uncharacterized protein with von Willebrand factor type A (vWA) domain